MISTDMIKIIPKKDIDSFVELFREKIQPYKRTVSDKAVDCHGDAWIICPHCGKVEHTRINKKTNESELVSALHIYELVWANSLNTFAFMAYCGDCRMRFCTTVHDDKLKFIPITANGDFVAYDQSGESVETNFAKDVDILKNSIYHIEPKSLTSENCIAYHEEYFKANRFLFAYSDTPKELHYYWNSKNDIIDTFMNSST